MAYLKDTYSDIEPDYSMLGLNPHAHASDAHQSKIDEREEEARNRFWRDIKSIFQVEEIDTDYIFSDTTDNEDLFQELVTCMCAYQVYAMLAEGNPESKYLKISENAMDRYNSILKEQTTFGIDYDYDQDGTLDADTSEEQVKLRNISIGK